YEVSRRLRGMLSLVDPAVKSWRTRNMVQTRQPTNPLDVADIIA
ncbi:hypothetical protein Tco_0850244, partial [Tanacetum coccineum]